MSGTVRAFLRSWSAQPSGSSEGPVGSGLDGSLRRALTAALAAWQLVMLAVVAVTDSRVPVLLLVILHVAAVVGCLLVLAGWLPLPPVLLGLYVVWCVDYLACDDVDGALLLAACWLGNLLYAVSAVMLPGLLSFAVPVGGAAAVGAVTVAGNPVWSGQLSSALVVTAMAMAVAVRLAMPTLWALSVEADTAVGLADRQERAREAARRASRESAEDARVVHDTIVNTLAAVANGVRGADQVAALRHRCRADADRIGELLRGRHAPGLPSLTDLSAAGAGIVLDRAGFAADELRRQESLVAPETLRALHAATCELIRNADKHSGADRVTVGVDRRSDQLEITVSDDGRGFDPEEVEQRGLDQSVRRRLAEVGGRTEIDSRPGGGAVVRILAPVATAGGSLADVQDDPADMTAGVDAILERAAWLWSAAVILVGLVIEAVNRPGQLTQTYLMLAITAGGTLLARWSTRSTHRMPVWVVGLLLAGLVPAFVAGLAGIDYGRSEVMTYQAIAITPLLVLLLTFAGTAALGAGLGVLVSSAIVVASALATDDRDSAVTILVAVVPAIGLSVGWIGFRRQIADLVGRAASERVVAARAATEVAARTEVALARRRWRAAGLTSSLAVVEGIAQGRLDPADHAVRHDCAEEEAYLRQLIQLSPDAYRMSAWFARALAESRRREVQLHVRSAETDASGEAEAATLGGLVVAAVAAAPPGSQLVASLFPTERSSRLVIVAAAGGLSLVAATLDPDRWSQAFTRLAAQEVLEVTAIEEPAAVAQ